MTRPSETAPRGGHFLSRLGARAVGLGGGTEPRRAARFEGAAGFVDLAAEESESSAARRPAPYAQGSVSPVAALPSGAERAAEVGRGGTALGRETEPSAVVQAPARLGARRAEARLAISGLAHDRDRTADRAAELEPVTAAKPVESALRPHRAEGLRATEPAARSASARAGSVPPVETGRVSDPPLRPTPGTFRPPERRGGSETRPSRTSAVETAVVRRGIRPAERPLPDAPAVRRGPSRREAPTPPPIRVTIGRIEIRAVQPPEPVASPAPRLAEPAVSLDHYLERRRGKR